MKCSYSGCYDRVTCLVRHIRRVEPYCEAHGWIVKTEHARGEPDRENSAPDGHLRAEWEAQQVMLS